MTLSDNPVAYEPEPSDVWIRARALDAAVRSVTPATIGSGAGQQRQEILARAARFERFICEGSDET